MKTNCLVKKIFSLLLVVCLMLNGAFASLANDEYEAVPVLNLSGDGQEDEIAGENVDSESLCLDENKNLDEDEKVVVNEETSDEETSDEETTDEEYCTVTFVSEYGSAPEAIKVKKGELVGYDVKPEYEEYWDRTSKHFNYWYIEGSDEEWCYKVNTIDEDTTLYAAWWDFVQNNYIVYDLNGGKFVDGFDAVEKREYGEVVTLATKDEIVKDGYKLTGWTLNGEAIDKIDDTTAKKSIGHDGSDDANFIMVENFETRVVANWEEITEAIVTFNTNGGSEVESQTVVYQEKLNNVTIPTKKGYSFEYWYTNDENNKFDTDNSAIEEDIVLNAKWSKNSYAVTFNTNGGTLKDNFTVKNEALYEDTVDVPTKNDITRVGYTFNGWFTDSKLTNKYTDNKITVENDFNLYAGWNENTYSITYNYGSLNKVKRVNKNSKQTTFTYGASETLYIYNNDKYVTSRKYTKEVVLPTSNDLEANGYLFDCWVDKDGKKITRISANTDKNIELTAKWKARPKYIVNIKSAFDKNSAYAKSLLTKEGYTVVDYNLNSGCKKKNNPYIYIGVKYSYDSSKAITDMKVLNQSKKCNDTMKIFRTGIYHSVKNQKNKNSDFNEAAGGRYIYIYYTRDKKAGSSITDLFVNGFDGFASGTEYYNRRPELTRLKNISDNRVADFNHDAGGQYIYVSVKR